MFFPCSAPNIILSITIIIRTRYYYRSKKCKNVNEVTQERPKARIEIRIALFAKEHDVSAILWARWPKRRVPWQLKSIQDGRNVVFLGK